MPDVREKLVELIGTTQYGNRSYIGQNFQQGFIEKIANHLIANGVTFAEDTNVLTNGVTIQRWIPVEERLPEDDISSARYLCYANGYVRILKYWRMYKSFEYGGKPIKVTHWMPLPEAPKGDD